ncbi:MAG: GAF domain-containing protein, partial [Terriglobales bacterium]
MPDPGAPRPLRERRRTVRQRLHTPVYVSFNSPQSDVVVDLSELLDLHEYGFAVQTAIPTNLPKADRLEVNRAVTLCLDLPETRQYVHGSGQVMWTDETGRAGIRFSFLPDRSRQALKEWLFANLLVASANHATRVNQLALHRKESPAPELAAQPEPQPISANPPAQTADTSSDGVLDQADVFSALDDVRQQMRDMQSRQAESPIRDTDSDLALQFITECAAGLTGASGVALALLTGDKIICRARVGDPAPPVGSEIGAGTGLSGECLRTGAMVSCADTESDPRVDPEICRRFGIGSFMAAPIFADFRVVGLLEIFSPYPHTFAEMQEVILERLADL